jgi:hypothetical protein
MSENNPYLQQENYFDGYQKSIDEMKNRPEVVEIDKLCYFVFEANEDGKRLLEAFTERFLIPGFINPASPGVEHAAIYYEGFKEAFRMIRNCVNSHKQRIVAENNKE